MKVRVRHVAGTRNLGDEAVLAYLPDIDKKS